MSLNVNQRLNEYLTLGGLFNPELADHDAVRDLLMDCGHEIERLASHVTCLADALVALVPTNVALGNDNWPDSTVLPLDVKLGELRQARAALELACPTPLPSGSIER